MARAKTKSIKDEFCRVLESSCELYDRVAGRASIPYPATEKVELHPTQVRQIVALAFMNVVSAWEEFVQSVFIRYMTGAESQDGYSPVLRIGTCQSIKHGVEVLSSKEGYDLTKGYLNWSSWKDVVGRARIFFKDGEPFSKVPNLWTKRLADAFVIRNRVAHASRKCIEDFKKVARGFLAPPPRSGLPRGFSVGHLLTRGNVSVRLFGPRPSQCENVFVAFLSMFNDMAGILLPS